MSVARVITDGAVVGFLTEFLYLTGKTYLNGIVLINLLQNSFENGTEQYYIEFYAGGEYKQYYIPLKDGEHTKITSYNADKRRSISGSKSNRYTLLETVSKTFYCFSKFVVEHDGQGRIALNEDGTLKKYFTFTSVLGNNQFNGFNYGVNLENIERTIDSSALVTKVYVQNIDNQYNESGLVTIQESKYNQMKEIAESEKTHIYLYSEIAKKSLEAAEWR